jgi:ABC-2 type transport system ATP-binding protein
MLDVQKISFRWGRRPLLDDVSFSVEPGELVVLAGPNGAGKTTLLSVLPGLILPTSGTVLADGLDAFAHPLRFRRVMGYLPESAPVDPALTVQDYLTYRAFLKGERSRKVPHRVREALSLCGLQSYARHRTDTLSQGLRKRTALAEALLLRPRFLFLDDLLAGLDLTTRAAMGRILATVATFAAVVVSGHELDELGLYATRFLVLREAKVTVVKTAAEARALLAPASDGGEA